MYVLAMTTELIVIMLEWIYLHIIPDRYMNNKKEGKNLLTYCTVYAAKKNVTQRN